MANHRSRLLIVLVAGLASWTLLLPGCRKPVAPQPGPAPIVKSVGKPLTEKECLAAAEEISRAVAAGDVVAFDQMVDWNAVDETSTAGVDVPAKFRSDFIKGINQTRAAGKGFSHSLIDAVKQGGSYRLLHSHTKDNRPWLLFRLLLPNAGVTYHDLPLARRPGGKVQATDVYIFSGGELLSETFRRLFVQAASQGTGGIVNRLTGTDQKFAAFIKNLTAMSEARRLGKFREALDIYKGLPPELRKDRSVLMLRLQSAQGLDDQTEYAQAIEDYRTQYPQDACVDILSIDYHLMRKEYAQSLACIDRLDKAVLGDPYLQTLRANIHTEANDLPAARVDLQKAMAADPQMIDAYWSLVAVTLKEKDFDATLKTLRQIRDTFGVQMSDLTTVPLYKDFVASPQYQEWLKDKPTTEPAEPQEKPVEAKPEG